MRTALKQFRIGKHLKQEELAKICGVSRNTYRYVVQGSRSGSQEFWDNLQRAFGVPDSEMYLLMKLEERTEQCETKKR